MESVYAEKKTESERQMKIFDYVDIRFYSFYFRYHRANMFQLVIDSYSV